MAPLIFLISRSTRQHPLADIKGWFRFVLLGDNHFLHAGYDVIAVAAAFGNSGQALGVPLDGKGGKG